MFWTTDRDYLLSKEYADSSSLCARARIHEFGTNERPWLPWVFDQFDLPPECRILELGSGPGALWGMNTSRIPEGWDITVTDFSPGMVEEAERNLRSSGRTLAFQVVDAESIPFDDEDFDVVIACHMLYHVPDTQKALSEMSRVLRPGGVLYASTCGLNHMREIGDLIARLTPDMEQAHDRITDNFGLDNGEEQLSPFFRDIELLRYDDELLVPHTQPVIDYVLSTQEVRDALSPRLDDLRRAVEDEVQTAGAFHIGKDVGLFIAWK